MGEGCGMLMLESLESAEKRNAKILGEIIGYAATADAYHLTSPDPNGLGAISSMTKALNNSKIKPDKIDYIKLVDINKITRPFKKKNKFRIFIAYYLGDTRLIDNI